MADNPDRPWRSGRGGGPSTPTTTPSTSGKSYEEILAEIEGAGTKAKGQVAEGARQAARTAGKNKTGDVNPLAVLGIIPASIAAATTPDSTLIGERGKPETIKRKGDLSLIQQLLGNEQLSLADPLKALFTDEQTQMDYLKGTESGLENLGMKALETVGFIGDIAVDPINWIGGAGLVEDAFKGIDEGVRLVAPVKKLEERALIDGGESFAARGLAEISKYHTALDAAEAGLRDGMLDDASALAAKKMAADAFRESYGAINGEALLAGENVLSSARYTPTGLIHEAPGSAKGRAALVTERMNELAADVGRATGQGPMVAGNTKLATFGGRAASDVIRDTYTGGYYRGLDAAGRDALGLTNRLWRGNPKDILSGRAFNPFSQKASGTLDAAFGGASAIPSPLVFVRKAGLGEVDNAAATAFGGLLQPGMGRSGQLWKAALENTIDAPAAREKALGRLEKALGTSIDKVTAEQMAMYPLTVLNAARLDGIIRAGGKALSATATRAQQEVSVVLARDTEEDATRWLVAGTEGVLPTPVWTRSKQAAFESVDGVSGAKGQMKVQLATALHDAMRRADIPADVMELERQGSAMSVTLKVADRVFGDPEFGADLTRIATENARRMAQKRLDEGDLARATLNALTTSVSIAKETDGVFNWLEALTRVGSAKELFSPRGAEQVGKEAKLLSYMEDIALAVTPQTKEVPLSTPELHNLINETADNVIGRLGDAGKSFEDLLETKRELYQGLRERGVTAERMAKIDAELERNVLDQESFRAVLGEAMTTADAARGVADDAVEAAKAQRQLLRDIESTADKLERTHLAILGYRELDEAARAELEVLDQAAAAMEMGTVATKPLADRIHQLIDSEFPPLPVAPPGVPAGGRSQATSLLNLALGDEDFRAAKAGTLWQKYNRFLGFARDVFGDNIELDRLASHAGSTQLFTRGFDQTEGAINRATIARFFEENAHPRMQALADEHGGWYEVLRRGNPEVLQELKDIGKSVQATARRLQVAEEVAAAGADGAEDVLNAAVRGRPVSSMGIAHEDLAAFTLGTLGDAIDAIRPLLDDAITFMETGQGLEKLERVFTGEIGVDTLNQFRNGDLSFLNTLIGNVADSVDVALGTSGAFGSYERFAMVRDVIAGNPALHDSFKALLNTLESIENSSVYMREVATLGENHEMALQSLEATLLRTPSITKLEAERGPLVDKLLAHDLPGIGRDVVITAEEATAAKAALSDALKEIRTTRTKLDTLVRNQPRLAESHAETLKELIVKESMTEHLIDLVNERSIAGIAEGIRLQREIDVLKETPLIATILGGSADFKVVQQGFPAFAMEPKVAYYTNSAGEVVRRSEEAVMEMWRRRLEGAAGWVDVMRDRAVNGYTTKGSTARFVEPVSQYTETARIHAAWLEEQSARAFSMPWRGAALADEGAAPAFIAIATNEAPVASTQFTAAWDMISSMLKAQFVGTASFSPRNLTGGTIENIRQGVNLGTSKKVWAADSVARSLEGFASFASTLVDGPEKSRILELVGKLQGRAEKHFGEDVFGAVVEARQAGVTESVLFKEISGQSTEGVKLGWRRSVAQAWQTGRLSNEARFGDSPLFGTLGSVTSAVAEIPAHPALWFEHHLAGGIERGARLNAWSKFVTNAQERADLKLLEEGAEDFIARPGVEALLRVDLFAQRRLSGDTVERAFDRVMESHFDYSDLSRADNGLRRIFPFWIWRSRSLAHYTEMTLHRPAMARTTFGLWSEQHKSKDDRAPRYTQEPGGGFDANSQLGLSVPDPGSDLVKLFQDVMKEGPTAPLSQAVQQDALPAIAFPIALASGRDAEGIPVDTATSIQGPLDAIYKSGSGGEAFVKSFAHMKKGKWYWNSPNAAYAAGEVFPMLGNVTKITTPLADGDGIDQKVLGAMARFFGAPIRAVPEAEQRRAQSSANIERRLAARNDR